MVYDLIEKIEQVDAAEIEILLKAILDRYDALFPDWEVHMISLEKNSNRNEQINKMIAMLEKLKTLSDL